MRAAVQAHLPFTLAAPKTLVGLPRSRCSCSTGAVSPAALVTYGQNLGGIAVIEQTAAGQSRPGGQPAPRAGPPGLSLPTVSINGHRAQELTPRSARVRFTRGGVDVHGARFGAADGGRDWQRRRAGALNDVRGHRAARSRSGAWSSATASSTAVAGVDLTVNAGDVYGYLGPNGAGKTTCLRMMLGLIRPTAGTVRLFGRDPQETVQALDGVAGFVEAPTFYPYLNGRRNLELLAAFDGGDARRPDRPGARDGRPHRPGRATGSAATRTGCASGSGSPRRCCAIRSCCCSTSRPPGSTPPECATCGC